jgi:hypothetical protein
VKKNLIRFGPPWDLSCTPLFYKKEGFIQKVSEPFFLSKHHFVARVLSIKYAYEDKCVWP